MKRAPRDRIIEAVNSAFDFYDEDIQRETLESYVADAVLQELAPLIEGLGFYADPDSYFAVAILADRPAGEFADDFGPDDEFPDYGRPMPGKLARDALRVWFGEDLS